MVLGTDLGEDSAKEREGGSLKAIRELRARVLDGRKGKAGKRAAPLLQIDSSLEAAAEDDGLDGVELEDALEEGLARNQGVQKERLAVLFSGLKKCPDLSSFADGHKLLLERMMVEVSDLSKWAGGVRDFILTADELRMCKLRTRVVEDKEDTGQAANEVEGVLKKKRRVVVGATAPLPPVTSPPPPVTSPPVPSESLPPASPSPPLPVDPTLPNDKDALEASLFVPYSEAKSQLVVLEADVSKSRKE